MNQFLSKFFTFSETHVASDILALINYSLFHPPHEVIYILYAGGLIPSRIPNRQAEELFYVVHQKRNPVSLKAKPG